MTHLLIVIYLVDICDFIFCNRLCNRFLLLIKLFDEKDEVPAKRNK